MSEERFDRLESQLTQVIQAISIMQQNLISVEQNVNAIRRDVSSLRNRIDSVEGSVSVVIQNTFVAHRNILDDLDFDLLRNERKTRRLSRRVARLERQELDDD